MQRVVPPPKYHVQRLVPSAKVAREAQLAGMFMIQRGGEGSTPGARRGPDILMTNCEDAYGFPPYPTIKGSCTAPTSTPARVERDIVTQAFEVCPATLLRSTTMDWAQRIARVVHVPGAREEALGLDWPRVERNPVERCWKWPAVWPRRRPSAS